MFKKSKEPQNDAQKEPLPQKSETINSQTVKQLFADSADVNIDPLLVGADGHLRVTVIHVDGMVNTELTDNFILKPLVQEDIFKTAKTEKELIDLIMDGAVYHSRRTLHTNLSDCLNDLLSGSIMLVFDKAKKAITFEAKGFEKRGIVEPTNENVLKGSKESFIEVLRVNTALVRRRLPSHNLVMNQLVVGLRTHTAVSLVYLKDVANPQIVEDIKNSIQNIKSDGVTSAGQIESYLIGSRHSFFPQILYTERVDKFCGNIAEGRIGILIDGMPIAYILPVTINAFLQAPEDYALNYIASSLFRILRYACYFIALVLPAFYVSVTTFHQEMIPTDLAVAIITSRQGTPFPIFLEVILMLSAFEILLEAGLRLPKAIGQTVSIVGALVVGQAAISANLLSPGVVIVIAASGITGFVMPSQDMANALRICRFILVFISIIGGMFSIALGLILILYHLCTIEVFGVPYLSPYVANEGKELLDDSFVRKPWYKLKYRPSNISPQDPVRLGDDDE